MAKRQLHERPVASIIPDCTPADGEPAFTLLARDRTAPATIRTWALRAARLGSPAEKVGTALIRSVAFEEWQRRHGSKVPD